MSRLIIAYCVCATKESYSAEDKMIGPLSGFSCQLSTAPLSLSGLKTR